MRRFNHQQFPSNVPGMCSSDFEVPGPMDLPSGELTYMWSTSPRAKWPWVKTQIVPPVNINQSNHNTRPKMGGEFTHQPNRDPKTVLNHEPSARSYTFRLEGERSPLPTQFFRAKWLFGLLFRADSCPIALHVKSDQTCGGLGLIALHGCFLSDPQTCGGLGLIALHGCVCV